MLERLAALDRLVFQVTEVLQGQQEVLVNQDRLDHRAMLAHVELLDNQE